METLILNSGVLSKSETRRTKAHIDSGALKALCHVVEERLDNYLPIGSSIKEQESDPVKYGVFSDINVGAGQPFTHKKIDNKIVKFQVQKKIVLEEYWDKGIEPQGVIPYSIFKEVMLKFGLFRFENIDNEGFTHTSPHSVISRTETLKAKKPINGFNSNISVEIFLIKILFILVMCTLVADFYFGVTIIKNPVIVIDLLLLCGINLIIAISFLGVNQLIHRKINSISIGAMINFISQRFSFGVLYFTSISIIELLMFNTVGLGFLFFLGLGAYWTIKQELKNIYNPYYSEELRGKINSLLIPDGCDAETGEKVLVNLLVQPPSDVKEMLGKLYPMPYSFAAESGAFKLTGEIVQKTLNLLEEIKTEVGTNSKGFIERWNDKVALEDPIIYRVHRKFDLVVILGQYGNLKREKEAMEYIQNLSDDDIYIMM